MKKLPDHWYSRVTFGLFAGWAALVYFYLGPKADAAYGGGDEGHILPGAAIFLAGVAGIFWLLTHLFDVPPSPPDDDPNIG